MSIAASWIKNTLPLAACAISISVHAAKDTFSLDRLNAFYDEFICNEKQVLAEADLSSPCAVFWISTSGNDANPGTREKPFLTLQRAQAAVRSLPSSTFKDQDVYVYIEEGTYRLQEPLVLTSRDSGHHGHDVIWSAAPGGDPIISGAIQITGWSLYDTTLNIYRTKIDPSYVSRQLYVNGNRAQRARTTPYPAGFLPEWTSGSPPNGGIAYITTTLNPPAWSDPTTWANLQDVEAVILTQWRMMRVPLDTITPYMNPTPGLLTVQQPAWNNANVNFDITTNKPGIWSFWQVTWFENALVFLTQPGQWYLDTSDHYLYYSPLPGEDIFTADVELPLLETLIEGQGAIDHPIHNIRFEGLTFSYATWLGSSSSEGYVADQSGQLLIGPDHSPNYIGHDQNVVPTPGNLPFTFANNIAFYGNIFQHLGAVALQFGYGSSSNKIDSNLFTDISSSAIEIGGATATDSHPSDPAYILKNNRINNNLIDTVCVEYEDAAGIFVGFSQFTTIAQNSIAHVPWSGIAMGWGWGLLDVPSFPGLPHAFSGEWGNFTTPTPNMGCRIVQNKIVDFINVLWDGGSIYTTGQQGPSPANGLLIQGNVAFDKRPDGGGNTFYTDGGSRYIQVQSNASYNNPIGVTFFGQAPNISDPFFLVYPPYYLGNGEPYGSDSGGCVTYGDIDYSNNYWLQTPLPANIATYNSFYHSLLGFFPYIDVGFFEFCPFMQDGIAYPYNLFYQNNTSINSPADIPTSILNKAGVQSRPSTIPANQWVAP